MSDPPTTELVDDGDDYYHVRFRDPEQYEEVRTPEWAKEPAESVSEGSEVRTGKLEGEDEWEITSVLVKKQVGEDQATEKAKEIQRKIES